MEGWMEKGVDEAKKRGEWLDRVRERDGWTDGCMMDGVRKRWMDGVRKRWIDGVRERDG